MRHRLLVLLLAALFGLGVAPASAHAQDNTAIAVNKKDGSSLFRFAFHIHKVGGDVVDQGNAAVAYASCDTCRTIAIAIQIVLVMGTPTEVTPTNLAVAINENCTTCETLATAYQFVIGRGEPVKLTKDGKSAIVEIRKALRNLGKSDLPIAEIQARVDELMNRLREVLATQLVPRKPGEEDDEDDEDEDVEEETPQTTAPASPGSATETGGTTTVLTQTRPATTETTPTTTPTATTTTTGTTGTTTSTTGTTTTGTTTTETAPTTTQTGPTTTESAP